MTRALAVVRDSPALEVDPRMTLVSAALDPAWRRGEWDLATLTLTLDTTDSQSALKTCRVEGCTKTARSHHGLCPVCRKEWITSGSADLATWLQTALRSKPLRGEAATRELLCEIEVGGRRCARLAVSRPSGLCNKHDTSLRHALARGVSEAAWRSTAVPSQARPPCLAPFCTTQSSSRKLCKVHYGRWASAGKPPDLQSWLATQEPVQNATQLWLGGLHPLAFAELLYVLGQRDAQGFKFDTTPPRVLARALRDQRCESLLDVEGPFHGATIRFEQMARDLLSLLYADQDSAQLSDEWDLRTFGLQAGRERGARGLFVDFAPIRQRWLRDLAKEWVLTGAVNRSDQVRDTLRGIALLSDAIALGPGHDDPSRLGHADIARFIKALRDTDLSTSRAGRLLSAVRAFVRHGRTDGWFDNIPGSFDFRPSDALPKDAPDEDDLTGRAIPEHVIRQLDAQTNLLTTDGTRGPLRAVAGQMRLLCYVMLRDTGRRLSDLAALSIDCVAEVPGGFELIYDNVKARRRGRHLPIEAHTADDIRRTAQLVADAFPDTPRTKLPLFPRQLRNPTGTHAIRPDSLGNWMDTWFDEVTVFSDHSDDSGTAAPFPRERLFPHAFRHAYAQRHADAGVDPDILRELMDHQSLTTTIGYYTVSARRRRDAVETVAALRVDRHGDRVGLISAASYGRQSVAVPFGNCQEPSNVAAGGKGCPIRFQCAGCSHYRPDPSFLPAIETHISELRQNREEAIASETATWVVDGLDAEIAAYRHIATTMKTDLAELSPAEQDAINEASAVLRRMRAATACSSVQPKLLQIGRRPAGDTDARN